MRPVRILFLIGLAGLVGLSACSRGDKQPELMNIRKTDRTPDEFAILPGKPLTLPQDMAALPDPTPGGANRTDPTPEADAIAALGGNGAQTVRDGGVARSDASLVNHTGRFGVSGTIRQQVAAEDLEYRRENDGRLLERVFNVNVYHKAYREQALDQHAELERWRRAGAKTPAAPPETLPEEN
ncbi:DUF3035 domain-containing protein [Actibacterium ureilyticum]|uniref:DUF3035 domain-containing protein n=1 Tax=Actibacterium ureilyticum TaxID=1590614 RepID=UPI000BAB0A59|nr:DUF3035 domain-containing protein [Actibacterium ureilyticum]